MKMQEMIRKVRQPVKNLRPRQKQKLEQRQKQKLEQRQKQKLEQRQKQRHKPSNFFLSTLLI